MASQREALGWLTPRILPMRSTLTFLYEVEPQQRSILLGRASQRFSHGFLEVVEMPLPKQRQIRRSLCRRRWFCAGASDDIGFNTFAPQPLKRSPVGDHLDPAAKGSAPGVTG
jgi:hypothetical protein